VGHADVAWVSIAADPRSLVDELAAHLAGKPADDPVFTTPLNASLGNRNARRDWFDAAAKAIGQASLHPSWTPALSCFAGRGCRRELKAVQPMLGHASAAMTLNVYRDLFEGDIDSVADLLDAVRAATPIAPPLAQAEIVDLTSVRQTGAPTAARRHRWSGLRSRSRRSWAGSRSGCGPASRGRGYAHACWSHQGRHLVDVHARHQLWHPFREVRYCDGDHFRTR